MPAFISCEPPETLHPHAPCIYNTPRMHWLLPYLWPVTSAHYRACAELLLSMAAAAVLNRVEAPSG